MQRRREGEFFVCPHCGADVPVGAPSCKECGSDAETGWSEGADVWDAGIDAGYGEEEDFDYDEFVEREFPGSRKRASGEELARWGWRTLVVLVALALLWTLSLR